MTQQLNQPGPRGAKVGDSSSWLISGVTEGNSGALQRY